MANIDFPSGLRPIRNNNGDFPVAATMDSVSTVLYKGQLAILSTTGIVGGPGTSIITSTIAKKCIGVFAEHKAAGAAGPDGNVAKALVYRDPDQLYVIQADDSSTSNLTTTIGRNFQLIGMNAGDSLGNSTGELDASTGTSITTSSVASMVKVVAVQKNIDNTLGASVSWTDFIVLINPKFHILANNGGV